MTWHVWFAEEFAKACRAAAQVSKALADLAAYEKMLTPEQKAREAWEVCP